MPTAERYHSMRASALAAYQERVASGAGDETGELFEKAIQAHVALIDLWRADLQNMDPLHREAWLGRQTDTHGFSKRFQNRARKAAELLLGEFSI